MSKIIFGLILGLFMGYFITNYFLQSEQIPKGYVRVCIKNKSGQDIKNLTLKHESGSIEMQDFSKADSANLIFKNEGENSYRIVATLSNGSTISSRGNYVESGYRTTEIIFPDSIKAE